MRRPAWWLPRELRDLPEVRRLMRLSFWNGFTFGALEHRVTTARREAYAAIERRHWV